jgi:hypothetical protein
VASNPNQTRSRYHIRSRWNAMLVQTHEPDSGEAMIALHDMHHSSAGFTRRLGSPARWRVASRITFGAPRGSRGWRTEGVPPLELPRRETPNVDMEFVEAGGAAVVGELDLQLHLVPGDGYPADRTVSADAGAAPRPVWRADGSSHLATSMPQHGGSGRYEALDATGRDAGVRRPGRPLEGGAESITRPPIQTCQLKVSDRTEDGQGRAAGWGASPCMSHALHGNTSTPQILP